MAETKQTDGPNKNKHQDQRVDASRLPTQELQLNTGSFPGGADGKEFACSAEDPGLSPGSGRSPGEGNGNPLQYACLENSMGRGAWCYSPWGRKESDTAKQLSVCT